MTDKFAQYDVIPIGTRRSLRDYLTDGLDPGSFLTAVLTNDLRHAIGRADRDNLAALKEIVMFLINRTPAIAHGNRELFYNWKGNAELRAECMASPNGREALAILDRRPGTAWMPDESICGSEDNR
jgi:hypothetical protein